MFLKRFLQNFSFHHFFLFVFIASGGSVYASSKKISRTSVRNALPMVFKCSECTIPIGAGCKLMLSHVTRTHSYFNTTVFYRCDCGVQDSDKEGLVKHLIEEHEEQIRGIIKDERDIDLISMIVCSSDVERKLERPAKREKNLKLSDKETRGSLEGFKRTRITSECDNLEGQIFNRLEDVSMAQVLLALSEAGTQ